MLKPSIDEARALLSEYSLIPVSLSLYADIRTPIEVLKRLREHSVNCFLLESVERGESWGRYSFLGFDPELKIKLSDGRLCVTDKNGSITEAVSSPEYKLSEMLSAFKSPRMPYLPPFMGGLVGYFAYDYIKYAEKSLILDADDPVGLNDLELMLFKRVIAFDHYRQKIIIIVNIKTEDFEKAYKGAEDELMRIAGIIKEQKAPKSFPSKLKSDFKPLFSENMYCNMVERVKHHIFEGDIFQAVLSNRFEADFEGDLIPTYRALRTVNPSPYMFYLSFEDLQIAGASPETLISVNDGLLTTFPIAGTCPRGETAEEDERLIHEMLRDEKELSEHNMLVDLSRNDLGKVSEFGSVKVSDYLNVLKFSHVSHITSKVTGTLTSGKTALDAISAVLPAGTLSGAPKITACRIINGLERVKRGVYGGAVGYIDFSGGADFCIAIRTAYLKNNKIYVQSGAGIVADSVPRREAKECMYKANAVINSIILSREVSENDTDYR